MKHYQIAGLTVAMEATGRTERQARPYEIAVTGEADITLQCNASRILELNPDLGNLDDALYVGLGAAFAKAILPFDGLFLHSSAVILDGKAYLFSAHSGVGKSTHTEKWCRLFGATYLNDDKPVLRLENGSWIVYGAPWSGKHDLSQPTGVPLGGIAFLHRGDHNEINPLPPEKAIPLFLSQSLRRLNHEQMDKQLTLVDCLLRQVPLWELMCLNNDEAARLSHDVMTR